MVIQQGLHSSIMLPTIAACNGVPQKETELTSAPFESKTSIISHIPELETQTIRYINSTILMV